jgi:ring-1,2-phenylacetyl-CoA epoxidase subunit PaaE
VRRVKGGAFSSWIHEHLKVGDSVQVMAPQAASSCPSSPARRHHVGIAGGSGITPILSIMKTVLAREPHSQFTLIYSNRTPASTMFKEEIEDLKNRYMARLSLHHVFTQEHVDAPLYAGRLDSDKLGTFLGRC